MRVLRKHRHHDKPVQPTVTINDADDNKIFGPAVSYTDHTREISNKTAAFDGGGGLTGSRDGTGQSVGRYDY